MGAVHATAVVRMDEQARVVDEQGVVVASMDGYGQKTLVRMRGEACVGVKDPLRGSLGGQCANDGRLREVVAEHASVNATVSTGAASAQLVFASAESVALLLPPATRFIPPLRIHSNNHSNNHSSNSSNNETALEVGVFDFRLPTTTFSGYNLSYSIRHAQPQLALPSWLRFDPALLRFFVANVTRDALDRDFYDGSLLMLWSRDTQSNVLEAFIPVRLLVHSHFSNQSDVALFSIPVLISNHSSASASSSRRLERRWRRFNSSSVLNVTANADFSYPLGPFDNATMVSCESSFLDPYNRSAIDIRASNNTWITCQNDTIAGRPSSKDAGLWRIYILIGTDSNYGVQMYGPDKFVGMGSFVTFLDIRVMPPLPSVSLNETIVAQLNGTIDQKSHTVLLPTVKAKNESYFENVLSGRLFDSSAGIYYMDYDMNSTDIWLAASQVIEADNYIVFAGFIRNSSLQKFNVTLYPRYSNYSLVLPIQTVNLTQQQEAFVINMTAGSYFERQLDPKLFPMSVSIDFNQVPWLTYNPENETIYGTVPADLANESFTVYIVSTRRIPVHVHILPSGVSPSDLSGYMSSSSLILLLCLLGIGSLLLLIFIMGYLTYVDKRRQHEEELLLKLKARSKGDFGYFLPPEPGSHKTYFKDYIIMILTCGCIRNFIKRHKGQRRYVLSTLPSIQKRRFSFLNDLVPEMDDDSLLPNSPLRHDIQMDAMQMAEKEQPKRRDDVWANSRYTTENVFAETMMVLSDVDSGLIYYADVSRPFHLDYPKQNMAKALCIALPSLSSKASTPSSSNRTSSSHSTNPFMYSLYEPTLPPSPHPVSALSSTSSAPTLRFTASLYPSSNPLPTWLHFNNKTCSFFGIPSETDTASLVIEITAYRLSRSPHGTPDPLKHHDSITTVRERFRLVVE